MTSDYGKPTKAFLMKRARNARQRRLEIRKMKSLSMQTSECGRSFAGEERCCLPENRKFAFKEVPSCEGQAEASMKDTKHKGVVGSMSSGLNLPGPSPSGSPDQSGSSLPEGQIMEKGGNEESSEKLTPLNCGSVSLIGRRRAMEDAVTVAPGTVAGQYAFFAAYDGHGGDRVAHACRDRLHKLLQNELEATLVETPGDEPRTSGGGSGNLGWAKVMVACFSRMDDEVLNNRCSVKAGDTGKAEEAMGSTAAVVMVGKEEVVVANCGDSRAVLCRGGVAVPLSNDHKPERADERERVEAAGGRIIDWNGFRVQGVLSTSRSIGDHYLKPYVISEPEVTVTTRIEADEFLIIATDGLWDVMSNDFACQVVGKCLEGRIRRRSSSEHGAAEAAAILAELAVAKGSRDNISVIVVELKTKL